MKRTCNGVTSALVTVLVTPPPTRPDPTHKLRHASILTVGAHDAPAISRPDVDADACLIEHLDFEPACACRCHRFEPPPVADWVLILSQTCACDLPGAMCNPCREDIVSGGPVRYCPRCGADLTGRFEPLR